MKIENVWDLPNQVWAKKAYDEDVKVLSECDIVICIYNGSNFVLAELELLGSWNVLSF